MVDLQVNLGRLRLANPILVASGTFGYAREMADLVDFAQLGGIIPKTVTQNPRVGNPPPRTIETASGMLNAIGLDNDGLDHFLSHHLPYLRGLPTAIIANIAGKSLEEFVEMAAQIQEHRSGIAALELNLSCPNVAGGLDFATDPQVTHRIITACRVVCPDVPLIAKLTPNVTHIGEIARAAADAGVDGVSCVNTFLGLVIDLQKRRPSLGNGLGGLSGPAIKPLALRCVWQVSQAVPGLPIIGVGGIQSCRDILEFLLAGATAVQLGTVNFYDPQACNRIVQELPTALANLGARSVKEIVGTLQWPK